MSSSSLNLRRRGSKLTALPGTVAKGVFAEDVKSENETRPLPAGVHSGRRLVVILLLVSRLKLSMSKINSGKLSKKFFLTVKYQGEKVKHTELEQFASIEMYKDGGFGADSTWAEIPWAFFIEPRRHSLYKARCALDIRRSLKPKAFMRP